MYINKFEMGLQHLNYIPYYFLKAGSELEPNHRVKKKIEPRNWFQISTGLPPGSSNLEICKPFRAISANP